MSAKYGPSISDLLRLVMWRWKAAGNARVHPLRCAFSPLSALPDLPCAGNDFQHPLAPIGPRVRNDTRIAFLVVGLHAEQKVVFRDADNRLARYVADILRPLPEGRGGLAPYNAVACNVRFGIGFPA